MEQYSHLLISSDPEFVPDAAQIESLYELLVQRHALRLVKRPPWEPGIITLSPSDKPRIRKNVFTGEEETYYGNDREVLERLNEIPAAVGDLGNYNVLVSSEWARSDVPICLAPVGKRSFEDDYICSVQCALRPKSVCTSLFTGQGPGGPEAFHFDFQQSPVQLLGVFTNPWTGARMEVPGAGSTRFWVRFEFGKWLFPRVDNGFDLLKPKLVSDAETCFGVRFLQAGIGL
jgi:hypothetical protein